MKKLLQFCLSFVVFTSFFFVIAQPAQAQGSLSAICGDSFATSGFRTEAEYQACRAQHQQNLSNFQSGRGVVPQIDDVSNAVKEDLVELPSFNFNSLGYTGGSLVLYIFGDESANIQGAVPGLTKALAFMYQSQPASTEEYIADVMNSAGINIAQPAYAQGVGLGFASLSPILETWKIFRNIAYFFYVILFLIIGFMIMFRQKISSQTVVTAQQALPKIIISLIAVTFSYAIAGLMIDAMYLIMYLIVGLFPGVRVGAESLRSVALEQDIFQVGVHLLTSGNLESARQSIDTLIKSALPNLGAVKDFFGFIGGITFAVVFALATVFCIFRLFFELLKTYVSIVIAIIIAPLALMLGALPGNNAFGAWIKTLAANLAVFPAVLIVLIFSFLLQQGQATASSGAMDSLGMNVATPVYAQGNPQIQTGGFLPPYLIGRGNADAIRVVLGLGVILVLPEIVVQVKSFAGKGGIFEQLAQNFGKALEKGWKGGEVVGGLGFTDTRKMPFGGVTGENILRKGLVSSYATAGGVAGGITRPGEPIIGFRKGVTGAGGRAALTLGDKEMFAATQERLKPKKK